MKVGGHVSAAGGVLSIFKRSQAIGANCAQLFVSSPRTWKVPPVDTKVAAQFKQQLEQSNLNPSFVHLKYLVNLASPNPETVTKSVTALLQELSWASALGLVGGMFHTGSLAGGDRETAKKQLITKTKEVLAQMPDDVLLLLENASSHNKIGADLEELQELVDALDHHQIGICIDTAHAFASGYDLRTAETVNAFVTQLDTRFGIDLVKVIHINDSKADFDSGRDLHENIGEGKIGIDGFTALLNHPKLQQMPCILEVPGFEKKGPDKKNVDIVKQIIK